MAKSAAVFEYMFERFATDGVEMCIIGKFGAFEETPSQSYVLTSKELRPGSTIEHVWNCSCPATLRTGPKGCKHCGWVNRYEKLKALDKWKDRSIYLSQPDDKFFCLPPLTITDGFLDDIILKDIEAEKTPDDVK